MKTLFKKGGILFFMFYCTLAQGQLAAFTFSVTKTNETCEANGTLSFSVQNVTAGSQITYSIFLLPNTVNPLTVTTQNNYTGLNSGSYLIVATQNLLDQSNSQQQTVTILDQVVPLQYQLDGQNAVCINNGQITVNVTQGQAVNYEIIAGPILKPLQLSPIFTGLSAGVYLVRVYDNCGNGIVQTYTLFESPSTINVSPLSTIDIIDCENAVINQTITSGAGVIFYPLVLQYTVTLPNGATTTVSQTITSGNLNFVTIAQNIPVTIGQSLTYSLSLVDGCGTTFNSSGSLSIPPTAPNLAVIPNGCGINNYKVQKANNVIVISAPAAYTTPLPYTVPSSGGNEYPLINFPPGTYVLQVTSLCGVVSTLTITVASSPIAPPSIAVRLGCENGFGSVKISSQVDIASAQLIQAPINAGFILPMDVSSLLFGTPQSVNMNNLPAGQYVFSVVDECGTTVNLTATIQSYAEVKTVNVFENCGSFDLFLNHATIPFVAMTYHLEKYFPNGNYWGHPITGLVGANLVLGNNAITYNIASSGQFRVIGKNFIYGNGGPSVNYVLIINEFDFFSVPNINAVYSFSCDADGFDVFVDAEGVGNLNYKIIAKNGVPILIDNATSSLFSNLEAGIYTFQVQDSCNNILSADFEVGSIQTFSVIASDLCPQQNATLSVAQFDYLSYQWWKGNDNATILSTTNSLNLSNFNPLTDSGMYHVRIFYAGSANSCIDTQLDYFINSVDFIMNAGENSTLAFCGSPGILNLNTILEGNPNQNGVWEELTNSGLLNGSSWNSTTINQGIFNFKYTVTGLCGAVDFALVQISIDSIPDSLSANVNAAICFGETIEFTTGFVENATYSWEGPNNFMSTQQNPIIENASSISEGTYFLTISNGICESEPIPVVVALNNVPDFKIAGNCINDNSDYQLYAEPTDSVVNPGDYSYSWNSPSGNVGSSNPISILGKESGIYTVTITNNVGCSIVLTHEVKGTVCKIPKGISPNGDGSNDSFDLTGFKVKKLIVYSRYGNIVYEQLNYTNQWHGQDFKDRKLPAATYFYHITTEAGEELVGWVFVIRQDL
jgi:gliding motility-associated-like protein